MPKPKDMPALIIALGLKPPKNPKGGKQGKGR